MVKILQDIAPSSRDSADSRTPTSRPKELPSGQSVCSHKRSVVKYTTGKTVLGAESKQQAAPHTARALKTRRVWEVWTSPIVRIGKFSLPVLRQTKRCYSSKAIFAKMRGRAEPDKSCANTTKPETCLFWKGQGGKILFSYEHPN